MCKNSRENLNVMSVISNACVKRDIFNWYDLFSVNPVSYNIPYWFVMFMAQFWGSTVFLVLTGWRFRDKFITMDGTLYILLWSR